MTGPLMESRRSPTYSPSPLTLRRRLATAMTVYPLTSRRALTVFQLDESANAPWINTTVGLAAPASPALANDGIKAEAADKTTARREMARK